MSFWAEQMPEGMLLRSPYAGPNLSDPRHKFTLDGFQKSNDVRLSEGIPLDRFVEYGRWFQKQAAPDVGPRRTSCVGNNGDGFVLITEDGDKLNARRVVVASGIGYFTNRPDEFSGIPAPQVLHSSELRYPKQYKGRKILVIGGGQSALESAALLHEAGAEVESAVRE